MDWPLAREVRRIIAQEHGFDRRIATPSACGTRRSRPSCRPHIQAMKDFFTIVAWSR